MSLLAQIALSLEQGDDEGVGALVRNAIDQGLPAPAILHDGLIAGMNVVGERFREREIFLPDVLLAARAMHRGIALIRPLLAGESLPTAGRVVLGTVQGDLHDIGKNLVGILLGGAGFEIIDLGTDVPAERFVETAVERDAAIIGMSALLTTTMSAMRDVVDLVRVRGLSRRVKVIVGGAPVSETWAREIGADAFAYDAARAVERVRQLVAERD